MAISYYSSAVRSEIFPTSGSCSFTLVDVGSGTDRLLMVQAYTDRSTSMNITGATYNGVSMTARTQFTDSEGKKYVFFHLANPTSGSNTLVISTSADIAKVGCVVAAYSGVEQSTIFNTPTDRTQVVSGGASHSFSQTSNSGETVVLLGKHWTSPSTLDTSSYSITERLESSMGFVFEKAGSATSTTVGFVPSLLLEYGGTSVALLDASGGAGGIPKTTKQTLLGVG